MKQFMSLGRTKSPCHNCPDLKMGCKCGCERYEEYQKIHNEEVQQIRKNKKRASITFWTEEQFKSTKDYRSPVWKQTKK